MAKKKIKNDILAQFEKSHPTLYRAFMASINDITSEAQVAMIAGALERGDIGAAIGALNINPEMFQPLDDALRGAYLQGGRNALAGVPALTDPFLAGVRWFGSTSGTRAPKSG